MEYIEINRKLVAIVDINYWSIIKKKHYPYFVAQVILYKPEHFYHTQ